MACGAAGGAGAGAGAAAARRRSTTMAMRRFAAASGSAGSSRSRSAWPVTLRKRASVQPVVDQQAPGRVRRGRWTAPSWPCRARVGRGVGVAGDRDRLAAACASTGAIFCSSSRARSFGIGGAGGEHRLAVLVEELDAQALRRHVDGELAAPARRAPGRRATASRICAAAAAKAARSRCASSARSAAVSTACRSGAGCAPAPALARNSARLGVCAGVAARRRRRGGVLAVRVDRLARVAGLASPARPARPLRRVRRRRRGSGSRVGIVRVRRRTGRRTCPACTACAPRSDTMRPGRTASCRRTARRCPSMLRAIALVGAEIVGEPAPLLLGGGVDQPHQQEERHHRGHEIGVRDLPGAAVMAALDHLFLADDHVAAARVLPVFSRHDIPEPQEARRTSAARPFDGAAACRGQTGPACLSGG